MNVKLVIILAPATTRCDYGDMLYVPHRIQSLFRMQYIENSVFALYMYVLP